MTSNIAGKKHTISGQRAKNAVIKKERRRSGGAGRDNDDDDCDLTGTSAGFASGMVSSSYFAKKRTPTRSPGKFLQDSTRKKTQADKEGQRTALTIDYDNEEVFGDGLMRPQAGDDTNGGDDSDTGKKRRRRSSRPADDSDGENTRFLALNIYIYIYIYIYLYIFIYIYI